MNILFCRKKLMLLSSDLPTISNSPSKPSIAVSQDNQITLVMGVVLVEIPRSIGNPCAKMVSSERDNNWSSLQLSITFFHMQAQDNNTTPHLEDVFTTTRGKSASAILAYNSPCHVKL